MKRLRSPSPPPPLISKVANASSVLARRSVPPKFCELFDFLNSLPNYKKKEKEATEGKEAKKEEKRGGAPPTDTTSLAALNAHLAEPWRAEMKEYNGGFTIVRKIADDKKGDDDSYGGMELLEELTSQSQSDSQTSSSLMSPFAQVRNEKVEVAKYVKFVNTLVASRTTRSRARPRTPPTNVY